MPDESSVPPNAPTWMAHLLERIDAVVQGQQDLLKLYRDLYDAMHSLIANQGREIAELQREVIRLKATAADNKERIGKIEVILGMGTDTERPPPEAP